MTDAADLSLPPLTADPRPIVGEASEVRALALVVAVAGCLPPPNAPMDPITLRARRGERIRQQRMALVGVALGVAASAVGLVLLDRGIELRDRESTADSEAGLGTLLGGILLTGSGVLVTGGSGIALGVHAHEISKLDDRIRELDAASP